MITDTQPIAATAQNELGTSAQPLKPYADRRAAGLPWLSEIPSHWDVRRSKYVFREVDKRSETGEETQLSMSQVHGLVESAKIDTWRLRSESYAGGKLCEPGDLVLNRLKAHLGVFAHASIPGVISPDYTVFRPVDDIEVRYFEHLYKTPSYKAELRKRTKGIVEGFWRLYSDDFYDVRVVVPPKDEQSKILAFIDSYDRRVRRLIRNKRRLIGLLNEQKQAIINWAVTRGLKPDAPMKPTGIDWMPEVPAEWVIKRIKHAIRERDTRSGTGRHELLSLTRRHGLVRHSEVASRPPSASDFSKYKVCLPGELVMNRMQAWSGMFGLVSEEGMVSPDYAVFAPIGDADVAYLVTLFKTPIFVQQFAMRSQGIGDGFNRLYTPTMGAIPIALPATLTEQRRILEHIENETRELSQLQVRFETEIALIQEYRGRLIADVVTGKLDVRHIEIAAPADEPISDDDDALDEDLEDDDAEVMEGADADD